ncbi:MAG: YfdX family protein [Chthoniobacterales bacterium]
MLMLVSTGADAADAITTKVDVTPPAKQLNGDEWRAVSLSANRVLKHIDSALDGLADKNADVASTNIEKGLTLIKIIDGVLPATTVKTDISGAGVTYDDQDQIKPAFVPIYREYDAVDVVSPVAEQQQNKVAEKNNAAPPANPKTAPEVAYAGGDYTSIKLDVRLARRDLLAAQDLIKKGDTAAATLALQDIQTNGVMFEFSATRMPLSRAMDNLRLAETELNAKRPDQAKAALGAATDALKNYEAIAGTSRMPEVQKLQKEINDVTKDLSNEKSDAFSKKISSWWNKCLEWFS